MRQYLPLAARQLADIQAPMEDVAGVDPSRA